MAAIEATALTLLLISSGVRSELTCSEERQCPYSRTCCGSFCIAVRICKVACTKDDDCAVSRSGERCVDGFCECLSRSSCANESIRGKFGMSKSCEVDSDCSRSVMNASCVNQTCNSSLDTPTDETESVLPLNPALLAIVTIIGVLMFSCLFCCCLSKMKSDRKSMKSREAKGKLKSLGIEPSRVENEKSSPLLEAESQGIPLEDRSSSGNPTNHSIRRERDGDMLISVVIETGLPPISEEDEEEKD